MKEITKEMIDKTVEGYIKYIKTEMSITNLKNIMKNPRIMSKYKDLTKKLMDKGLSKSDARKKALKFMGLNLN